MILLRTELGEALREQRTRQSRTLREVSREAKMSLGYLSEVERGTKEASSELLSAICVALGITLSTLLEDVTDRVAAAERSSAPVTLPVGVHRRSDDVSASAA